MKTIEETYKEYLCCNCKNNQDKSKCNIHRADNTTYCCNYIKDKTIEGYKRPIEKTAKIGHAVMPKLIGDWSKI